MSLEIQEITAKIKEFRDKRDWAKFHDPKNLAISLSVESAELLELFRWKEIGEVDRSKVQRELADVFYAAFLLADSYGFDVQEIVYSKLRENEVKYPLQEFKGSNRKYNEY